MSNLKGEVLRYGQTVSISPLQNQSLCIFSDGLIKTNAKLIEITPDVLASGALFYQSLYRIYPSFVTGKLNEALHFETNKKNEDGQRKMKEIKELQKRIIVDYKKNIEDSQKAKDKPLSFNEYIQFLHVATNKYLCCSLQEAKEEKESFRLELAEYPSTRTTFRLQPAFQHQIQQEALIYAGDSVYISCKHIYLGIIPKLNATLNMKNMNNEQYLRDRQLYVVPDLLKLKSLADQLHQNRDTVKINQSIQKFQKAVKMSKNQSFRKSITQVTMDQDMVLQGKSSEVNVSLEKKSPWVLNIFCQQNDLEQVICFNDIIWIQHIEENSLISMARSQDNNLVITFLQQGAQGQQEFEGDSNGMFQVESETMMNGGMLEWGQNLRLRHFILGKYLAIHMGQVLDKSGQQILYLTDKPTPNTLFQFIPVPTMGQTQISQKYVTKDAFMKLKTSGKKHQWVHIEQKKILAINQEISHDVVQEEDKSVLVVRLTDHTEDDDVLKLYKANYSDVIEANFLVTSFPVLRKSLTYFQRNKHSDFTQEDEKQKFNKVMNKLSTTITQLDKFTNNIVINTQLDSKNTKSTIEKRQKILREQFFIDLLIEIMKVLTNEEELKRYSEYQMQQHILSLEKKNGTRHHTHHHSSKHNLTVSNIDQSGKDAKSPNSHPVRSQVILPNSQTDLEKAVKHLSQISSTQHAAHSLASRSHHSSNAKEKQKILILTEKMNALKIIYKLLKSICQDNQENQIYVYHRFANFIYQIQYFREATEFIITVLSGNDTILNNLCDNINMNERLQKKARPDDQSENDSHESEEVVVQQNSKIDDKNNILLYYYELTQKSHGQHNIQYLEFFRSICKLGESGLSVNQEMIFKFMKKEERFKSSLFMPIIIEATKMKIVVSAKQISYLTSIKDPLIYNYLITQLFLFADLAYQRNFLWKSYLEQIFPTQFIFDQIFEKSMPIQYRSAFCNMATAIYVDHEPFNLNHKPVLCRLFEVDPKHQKTRNAGLDKIKKLSNQYNNLVEQTFKFLDQTCLEIDQELEKKKLIKQRNQLQDDEPVTNQLILDIIKLISIMIRYDMLKILGQDKICEKCVPRLILLLEYDRNNLLFPFILNGMRKNEIQKAKDKLENKINVMNVVGAANSFISNMLKALQGSILGIPTKQQASLEDEFVEFDTAVIARNPIVGSLISITNYLDNLAIQDNKTNQNQQQQKSQNVEMEIKKEICNILLYFQDLRQDFFISNFIQFYKNKTSKMQFYTKDEGSREKLIKELDTEIVAVLPPLMKTSIENIDKKAQDQLNQQEDTGDMQDLIGMGNLLTLQKKFQNLLKPEDEYPDLDRLMAGENASRMEAQLLPSIMITFYITSDNQLLNKLIDIMRRSFGQTSEMFTYLNKIEMLFDKNEIACYQFLENSMMELKQLTECSEVWLTDFQAKSLQPSQEIAKIIRIAQDIRQLLRDGTSIDHKGRVIQGPKNQISLSRQKIFNFLNVQLPIVNFIRDTQQQFVKQLDDQFYHAEIKNQAMQLLTILFKLLTDFCWMNNDNQAVLHRYVSLFLDEVQHDYGQLELVTAIHKDNKLLCQNISDILLSKILRFIKRYGRQPRFLTFYKSIQTYKNNPITEIQQKVISLFIPQHIGIEDYIDIHEFNLYGEFKPYMGHKVIEFIFNVSSSSSTLIDMPYVYHSEILQVFLSTIVGEESFKINGPKLKKLFKLHYLLQLLLMPDDMLDQETMILDGLQNGYMDQRIGIKYMKPQLIEMINVMYVNNKVTDLYLFIKEQATFTQYFIDEKNRLLKIQVMNEGIEGYVTYFFDHVINLMRYYSEKVISKEASQEYKDREDYVILRDIMMILHGMSQTILSGKLQAVQYNNLVKFVFSIDKEFFQINAGQFSMCLDQSQDIKLNDQADEPQPSIFTQKRPQMTPLIKKQAKTQMEISRSDKKVTDQAQKLEQHEFNWVQKSSWLYFINACQSSARTQKQQNVEMRMLTNSFIEIQKFIPEQIIKELNLQIVFTDVLKKLIKYVEKGIVNKADKRNLIFTLKIMQDMLDSAPVLVEIQNTFEQCQASRMFLNLLAEFQTKPFEDDLLQELFSFALKLAHNGNQKVQKSVYNYLSNFENSELIFLKMYQIIYEVINENKLREKSLQQKQSQKEKDQSNTAMYLSHLQSNNGDDIEAQREAMESRKNKMSTLVYLLQFLQLLCEGHNLEIQNYLRQQTNSRNNYNIVQAMVELLCAFEKDLQRDAFELVINTLETLTELVQGPCLQNQQDIIDSMFLEVASNYLSMQIMTSKKNKKSHSNTDGDDGRSSEERSLNQRSNSLASKSTARRTLAAKTPQIDRWMLERLKYKIMVLVSSLLELNTDKFAIRRILRSLPISVLRKNLITIYKKHNKMYKKIGYNKESLGHLRADPNDPKIPVEYHEMILETGFLIYFLMNYYLGLETRDLDQETRNELEEIKEFQKESEQEDPWTKLENTLLGQIASLVYNLLTGIFEMVNEYRNKIQQKIMEQLKSKGQQIDEEALKAQKKQQQQQALSESIKFFAQNSATIEVVRYQKIEKIIFYKLSFCKYLPQETKVEFHESVDRDSTNSKIQGLDDQSRHVMEVCKHEEYLSQFFQQNKIVAIFAKYVILWQDLSFLLSIALNILIVLSYYSEIDASLNEEEQFHKRIYEPNLMQSLGMAQTKQIFIILGTVMIVCSTFVVSFFILKKGPLYVREAWNQSQDLLKDDQGWAIRLIIKLYMVGFCFVKVLLNVDMIYYLAYGAAAFVATLYHPFIFAFHLSSVVLRYPTLRNIIKSFWEPKVALGLTFVLVMLMNYYFSIVAYIWFVEYYAQNKCQSLWICFLTTFDLAFKNNGGIGGWFEGNQEQSIHNYDYARFVFDNLNNILIQLISIQIFSGIIIDTFKQLRQQELERLNDKDNICFICGLERELFDRKSDEGFINHTTHEHNMWNYVFYIAYLYNKDSSEFNGVETYIWKKNSIQDYSWFPIGQSLNLQGELEDKSNEFPEKVKAAIEKFNSVKQQSQKILQYLEDIQASLEK